MVLRSEDAEHFLVGLDNARLQDVTDELLGDLGFAVADGLGDWPIGAYLLDRLMNVLIDHLRIFTIGLGNTRVRSQPQRFIPSCRYVIEVVLITGRAQQ